MPRPTKCRMICRFPQTAEFIPANSEEEKEAIIMTLDEFETIRLIDKEGLSQEQCSKRMQVARTTAQKIYENARKKLADMLVEGLPLKIKGGEYRLCSGKNSFCYSKDCYKEEIHKKFNKAKGANIMRIAVTYENGEIFQHFGHTEQFKIYDIEDKKIVSSEIVDTNGSGHGALAEVLSALKADVLICGGIGGGAQEALKAVGITLYGGAAGDTDAAVHAFLAGSLEYNPNVKCSHHDEHHHGEHHHGEGCGGHGHHHHNHECRHGHC
ncbi:MAG: DUF134 domain-containing protein [Clostridiales bacterium]|nr:DUF134 domain-containing protein [Clostridiales bacterium]